MTARSLTVILCVTFAAGILTGLLAHRLWWLAVLVALIFGGILRFVALKLVRE